MIDRITERFKTKYDRLPDRREEAALREWAKSLPPEADIDGDAIAKIYENEHLRRFRNAGVDMVKLVARRDSSVCEYCQAAEGEIYTVEEALQREVLPHGQCANEECLCTYMPARAR